MVRNARARRAGALPDGSNPTDPPGSFPHIPYYAIGCTLDEIQSRSLDGRMAVQVIGQSAAGRAMYLVTINELEDHDSRRTSRTGRTSAGTR